MLPVHGPRTSTNLFHTIVGAEGVSINNVNLEHLSGVEKDKKDLLTLDFIKICFDFRTAFCVSAKFGSYAARNMFP